MIRTDTLCPSCLTKLTLTKVEGNRDTDLSMCLNCGSWAVHENDKLRRPTFRELQKIGADTECKKMRLGWLNG